MIFLFFIGNPQKKVDSSRFIFFSFFMKMLRIFRVSYAYKFV